MTRYKHFEEHVEQGVNVLRLQDPRLYEMIIISELHDELLEFVERNEPRKLLVDFSLVTQCSSAVINSLLLARQRIMKYSGSLRLCCMHQQVRKAFQIMRLEGTLLPIDDSFKESLRAFGRGAKSSTKGK